MNILLSSDALTNIRFPNLGIELKNVPRNRRSGFRIAFMAW